jgi:hypothetical protein
MPSRAKRNQRKNKKEPASAREWKRAPWLIRFFWSGRPASFLRPRRHHRRMPSVVCSVAGRPHPINTHMFRPAQPFPISDLVVAAAASALSSPSSSLRCVLDLCTDCRGSSRWMRASRWFSLWNFGCDNLLIRILIAAVDLISGGVAGEDPKTETSADQCSWLGNGRTQIYKYAWGRGRQGLWSAAAGLGVGGGRWDQHRLWWVVCPCVLSEKGSRPIEKIESATTLVFILEPKPTLFYSFVGFAWLGCGM